MREKTRRGRLNEYGNEYGKYAACVLSGFVLYGLSEAVGEIGDPVRDGVLARNEYGGGDRLLHRKKQYKKLRSALL